MEYQQNSWATIAGSHNQLPPLPYLPQYYMPYLPQMQPHSFNDIITEYNDKLYSFNNILSESYENFKSIKIKPSDIFNIWKEENIIIEGIKEITNLLEINKTSNSITSLYLKVLFAKINIATIFRSCSIIQNLEFLSKWLNDTTMYLLSVYSNDFTYEKINLF